MRKFSPLAAVKTVLLEAGHVTEVAVGEAVDVLVVLSVPPVFVLVVEVESDVEVTNFAPQMLAFETGAPRLDLR